MNYQHDYAFIDISVRPFLLLHLYQSHGLSAQAMAQAAYGRKQALSRDAFRDFMLEHLVTPREAEILLEMAAVKLICPRGWLEFAA